MDTFVIGVVRKSHGVRGFLRTSSFSGEYQHFLDLKQLTLKSKDGQEKVFSVEDCKINGSDILLKLEGLDNPEEVKKYLSWEICVPRANASPLKDGQFYIDDLCGCTLFCGGKTIGKVKSVIDVGHQQMLEITNNEGKTYLIPFVDVHVGEVNINERTIELKSEWLLS